MQLSMNASGSIRQLFLISGIFLIVNNVHAQTNPYGEVSIASPTAASLGKYADIPVNYHTGIPQINIPIYTVKAGTLELPIGLSYHGGGLKVEETASWVGTGWSLDAGGVITRTVMGLPDEKGTNSGSVSVDGYFSDFGYNKYLYTTSGSGDQDWDGFASNRKDGQPDLFFFNFSGYSGKFFFRDDQTPILVPQQDIKIIPYYPGPTGSIQGFTIITPDGNQYLFGNTQGFVGTAPTEITNPFSSETGLSSGSAISSWFLNKIISADGQFSISLSYTTENYGYYTVSSYPISSNPGPFANEFALVKNIISGVRLTQITSPNGTITFNAGAVRTDLSDNVANNNDNINANAKTLGSIQITDGSFCKKELFYYSYFTDNTSAQPSTFTTLGYTLQTDKKRLRLDSVKEQSCDSTLTIPPHVFTYFTELLPRRINFGLDHWGFYNGVTTNQTLIPTFNTYDGANITAVSGANRSASWPAMRGGALQQITYPTGGFTTFDFEPSDSYNYTYVALEQVFLGGTMVVNTFGQTGTFTSSQPFTSNGNTITLSVTNYANFSVDFSIKNSSNVVVYTQNGIPNNNYPGNQTLTFTTTLAAGNYTGTLTINSGATNGATASLSQLANVSHTDPVTIGGLRIKTITHKESASDPTPIITSYTYPSGGYLYSFPTYVQHIRNDLVGAYGFYLLTNGGGFQKGLGANNGCPLSGSFYLKSGGSLRPMATTQGFHIGFPTVNVTQTGNGHSTYNYYTSNTGFAPGTLSPQTPVIDIELLACEPSTPNFPAAPLPFDSKKGELYYEQHYNEAGQLLKDIYYYPDFDTANIQPAPAFIVTSWPNPAGGSNEFGTLYNAYSPRKTKLQTIETDYAPGVGSVMINSYTYYGSNYHRQVTRKVTATSTGDSLITNTMYSPDFHLASWDVSPSCETTYANSCSSCLTTYNSAVTACSGNGTCISNQFLAYRLCLSNARNSYVDCQVTNYTGATNTYKTNHTTSKTGAGTELKPILDLQDENRVVPIEVSEFKNNNFLHANFTRYDYVSNPSAIPYPNRTQLVNLQATTTTFTNAVISGATLTKDSRYADESFYQFNIGNPQQVTPHDADTLSYIWDYLNQEPIAKVMKARADQIAHTSFEADGSGGWTITGSARDNTTAFTGSKSYNMSGGAITRASLISANTYVVSYWTTNASAYTITGTIAGFPIKGKTIGSWTYFEHKITGQTSISISGTGNIDELRLYPAYAQMMTYTYTPMVGMTSECDINNRVTNYVYDVLGRLKYIKDQDGNIIKTIDYHYKTMPLP